jgi:hypothetical protein
VVRLGDDWGRHIFQALSEPQRRLQSAVREHVQLPSTVRSVECDHTPAAQRCSSTWTRPLPQPVMQRLQIAPEHTNTPSLSTGYLYTY